MSAFLPWTDVKKTKPLYYQVSLLQQVCLSQIIQLLSFSFLSQHNSFISVILSSMGINIFDSCHHSEGVILHSVIFISHITTMVILKQKIKSLRMYKAKKKKLCVFFLRFSFYVTVVSTVYSDYRRLKVVTLS